MSEEQQFFEEDEAEQILLLAARKSASGAMSREQLLANAAEAGISPEAVLAAESEYRTRSGEVKERLEFDKHVKGEFWSHLGWYLVVNLGLIGMDLFKDGKLEWAFWPLLGWGIGIFGHAWTVFARGSDDNEREFRRWRARKSLRETGMVDEVSSGAIAGIHIGSGSEGRELRRRLKEEAHAKKTEVVQRAIQQIRAETGLSHKDAKEIVHEYLEENE